MDNITRLIIEDTPLRPRALVTQDGATWRVFKINRVEILLDGERPVGVFEASVPGGYVVTGRREGRHWVVNREAGDVAVETLAGKVEIQVQGEGLPLEVFRALACPELNKETALETRDRYWQSMAGEPFRSRLPDTEFQDVPGEAS